MKHSGLIRRSLAAAFLLLFSFCVTPKRVLHDLLAHHRDAQTSSRLPEEQITASGFHCQIDDLVVVAPFLSDMQLTVSGLSSSTRIIFSEPVSAFFPAYTSHTAGRGPPAHFCV